MVKQLTGKRKIVSRFIPVLIWLMIIITIAVIVIVQFSPYKKYGGNTYKSVQGSIIINASVDSVFRYMSVSANASKWSVFVHHITTLNPESFTDGSVGCIRRCFCHADEAGRRWDETIVEVIPNVKRRLTIFNLIDFPATIGGMVTEQAYKSKGSAQCELTLSVFFGETANPGFFQKLKLVLASYKTHNIFKNNLHNIKQQIEGKIHG